MNSELQTNGGLISDINTDTDGMTKPSKARKIPFRPPTTFEYSDYQAEQGRQQRNVQRQRRNAQRQNQRQQNLRKQDPAAYQQQMQRRRQDPGFNAVNR